MATLDTITDITDIYPIQGIFGDEFRDEEWSHDQEPTQEDEESFVDEEWCYDQQPSRNQSEGRVNGVQHEPLVEGQSLKDWIKGVKQYVDLSRVAAWLGLEMHNRSERIFVRCNHQGEGIRTEDWSCLISGQGRYLNRWFCFGSGAAGDVFDFIEHFGHMPKLYKSIPDLTVVG